VLIGPNNCGKSAVISALETLCRSTRGDFMVRHGEREARVTVETDDGHNLTWRRKGGTVSYVIDGREVHRDVPTDLHEHLKLPLVKSDRGDHEFDVHFGQQKSPIFLLDEPPSRAATFFSASSDTGRLLEIQDRHREKVRERKRRRSDLTRDAGQLERELAELAGLGDLSASVARLESEQACVAAGQSAWAALAGTIERLDMAARHLAEWREETAALGRLQTPSPLADVEPLQDLIARNQLQSRAASRAAEARATTRSLDMPPELSDVRPLTELQARLYAAARASDRHERRRVALGSVSAAPELGGVAGVESVVSRLTTATRSAERLAARSARLHGVTEPPVLPDPAPLEGQIRALARARGVIAGPSRAAAALATLRDPPGQADPASLAADVARLGAATAAVAAARVRLASVRSDLEVVERDARRWAASNPECPVCGGAVTVEGLLGNGGHGHG
jgi:exonuclease SbcC